MWPQILFAGVQTGLQHLAKKNAADQQNEQIKFKQIMQERRNAQVREAADDALGLNQINLQRVAQDNVAAEFNITKNAMKARSLAIVNAAASGTAGTSVNDSILDVERNAAQASLNASTKLRDQVNALNRNVDQIETSAYNQMNFSQFMKVEEPKVFESLLQGGINLATSTYGKEWDFQSLGEMLGIGGGE